MRRQDLSLARPTARSDQPGRRLQLKRAVQHALRSIGLHAGRYPPVDSRAYHLKTLLRELKIDQALDVGAHVGEFASLLREIDYAGQIVSFEPVRDSFEALTVARRKDKRWRGENVALGREDGEMPINIYASSVFNSFLGPIEDGIARFAHMRLQRTESVRLRRLEHVLDEVLEGAPSANIFVKMDTQGYDLQVLRGAGRHLGAIRAIQTEVAVRPIYAGVPKFTDTLGELERLGFAVTGIFPVTRELDRLRVIEFDCILCRTPSASGDDARES